ncbi:helix-turn-helix domain-containing protein [Microbulbifer sp. TYP-18]|uniref:helix-turn-helix domain-containing protein n=1 Tax=Microbulbifer sp. TYP-18 TaxID=3230024 RepID=UPI0034C6D8FD
MLRQCRENHTIFNQLSRIQDTTPFLNDLLTSIGIRIRRRALQLNLKQHQVAEALGVSRGFICDLYAGRKRGVSFEQIVTLCTLLDISADQLLDLEPGEARLTDAQMTRLLTTIETAIREQTPDK